MAESPTFEEIARVEKARRQLARILPGKRPPTAAPGGLRTRSTPWGRTAVADIDPREIAVDVILSAARDPDDDTVQETISDHLEALLLGTFADGPEWDERDDLEAKVRELIATATITVAWPDPFSAAAREATDE